MKKHVKTAIDTLVGLDFTVDSQDRKLRGDRWIFTHGNAPDQRLTINFHMSQAATSKIIRHAEAIVGLASTESDPTEKASRQAAAKRREKAEREKAIREAAARAEAKEKAAQEQRHRQYVSRQMRDRLTTADQLYVLSQIEGDWIEPDRITDELCISTQRVKEALDSGALEAYMHSGKVVRCKISDVAAWVRGQRVAA